MNSPGNLSWSGFGGELQALLPNASKNVEGLTFPHAHAVDSRSAEVVLAHVPMLTC